VFKLVLPDSPDVGGAPSMPLDRLPLPDKPSIAVLPFSNMSADPEQEYFCDGISDDIITELSRFRSLFVIARNSSFTYKGRAIDVRTVSKELGVRYVLEGSARRAGTRLRLTAQLLDAITGAHLWAEKYDREGTQIFDIQEELTQRIVVTIAPFIEEAERERVRRRPENIGAYEVGVRGMATAYEAYRRSNPKLTDEAIALASTALRIDPRSVISLVALAFCQWQRLALARTLNAGSVWEERISAATRAIEVDRHDCTGYVQKAMLLAFAPHVDRRDEALPIARRAFELNPHNMGALMILAFVEAVAGHTTRAIEHLEEVLRISPRDPMRYVIYLQFSETYFLAGRYAEGALCAALGIEEAPAHGVLYGWLALNRAGLGDLPRARTALEEAKKLAPGWIERGMAGGFILRDEEHHARVTSLLRIVAGVATRVV
jgi:adenylate cyclase